MKEFSSVKKTIATVPSTSRQPTAITRKSSSKTSKEVCLALYAITSIFLAGFLMIGEALGTSLTSVSSAKQTGRIFSAYVASSTVYFTLVTLISYGGLTVEICLKEFSGVKKTIATVPSTSRQPTAITRCKLSLMNGSRNI